MAEYGPRKNAEGYPDPTAYNAIKNVESETKRVSTLVGTLKYIVELAGFEVVGRFVLRDRSTGKVYQ